MDPKPTFVRDPKVSGSEFGQWVFDELPHTMYAMNVDLVIYKKSTKILRILEEKLPNQDLKPSQRDILPILAAAIEHLVDVGKLHRESGVFVVLTEAPYEHAKVMRLGREATAQLSGERWLRFCRGESLCQP